ncbi:MAG: hypothetical protein ABSD99_12630, partial [Candidatus Bathyarchaeia archaeon]
TPDRADRHLTPPLLAYPKDPLIAATQRLRVWTLAQIPQSSRMIGEVTINRILEKPSAICEYLPLPEARAS